MLTLRSRLFSAKKLCLQGHIYFALATGYVMLMSSRVSKIVTTLKICFCTKYMIQFQAQNSHSSWNCASRRLATCPYVQTTAFRATALTSAAWNKTRCKEPFIHITTPLPFSWPTHILTTYHTESYSDI